MMNKIYDYIMVYSDEQYDRTIQSLEIERFYIIELGPKPISKRRFHNNEDDEKFIFIKMLAMHLIYFIM